MTETTKQNKWTYVAGCLAVLVVLLLFPVRTWLSSRQTRLTDQQTREILNRELPAGSSKSRVIEFLKARRWTYSDSGTLVQAMFRDSANNGLIRTDIQVRFFFDSSGELVSYEMQDFYTGP